MKILHYPAVCVCVCEREKEIERQRARETERAGEESVCEREIFIQSNLDSFHGFQLKISNKIVHCV